mgnify:CR=1 FL=1
MTMAAPTEGDQRPGMSGSSRSSLLVASGVGLIVVMALLAPKVGPIGVGTFIALVVAVLATRSVLSGHRDKRLQ